MAIYMIVVSLEDPERVRVLAEKLEGLGPSTKFAPTTFGLQSDLSAKDLYEIVSDLPDGPEDGIYVVALSAPWAGRGPSRKWLTEKLGSMEARE